MNNDNMQNNNSARPVRRPVRRPAQGEQTLPGQKLPIPGQQPRAMQPAQRQPHTGDARNLPVSGQTPGNGVEPETLNRPTRPQNPGERVPRVSGSSPKEPPRSAERSPIRELTQRSPNTASQPHSSANRLRPQHISFKRADEFIPDKHFGTDRKNAGSDDGKPPEETHHGGALSSLLKAIIYIVFVLTISGFLSYFAITVGNDMFAFIKPSDTVTLTVPEYATLDNITELLHSKGLIKYPLMFKVYSILRKDNGIFVAGDYDVSPDMNYDQLRKTLKGKVEERKEVSITIPEGYTIDEIIDLFVITNGIGTREGFIDAIQNAKFDYWFIDEMKIKAGRKYRLEGYLYPDTYYFFTDWNEERILNKLLFNFASKFDQSYKERCAELGMTVDELITLASMIEAEGKFTKEFGAISAVFQNRIKNPSVTGGRLESDATIQYVLPERHEELTVDDLALKSPYNTYINAGLPPGPITNPTLDAIHSAMFPDEVDYYYFVAQPNGESLFSRTLAEHQVNKQKIAKEKAAAATGR